MKQLYTISITIILLLVFAATVIIQAEGICLVSCRVKKTIEQHSTKTNTCCSSLTKQDTAEKKSSPPANIPAIEKRCHDQVTLETALISETGETKLLYSDLYTVLTTMPVIRIISAVSPYFRPPDPGLPQQTTPLLC